MLIRVFLIAIELGAEISYDDQVLGYVKDEFCDPERSYFNL